MILIGENLNVISQTLGPALKDRNAGPIEEMAKAETEAGIDLVDLNIGPARRGERPLTRAPGEPARAPVGWCRSAARGLRNPAGPAMLLFISRKRSAECRRVAL